MPVELNQPVPAFTAQATSGVEVSPDGLRGKQVVLYFYPKDNTPGCTTEGQDFRDLHDQFLACDTLVFGVSRDSLKTHENFRSKQGFPFELICDKDEQLCQLFDVIKQKKLYGKDRSDQKYIYSLFPTGLIKCANKVAGLPRPKGCS